MLTVEGLRAVYVEARQRAGIRPGSQHEMGRGIGFTSDGDGWASVGFGQPTRALHNGYATSFEKTGDAFVHPRDHAVGVGHDTSKINFVGMSESLLATGVAPVTGDHQVRNQLSTAKTNKAQGVKDTDARGIPPRGRPV